jgi:hypothetical protein
MIAVAVVLPSDIDRDMIKLWDATRLNDRYLTCSRTTGSEMLHRRNQNQVPRRRVRQESWQRIGGASLPRGKA